MIRIALTMNSACLLEVHTYMHGFSRIHKHSYIQYSRDLSYPVSINFVVAMIAGAQGDVVIDIERRPIVSTEVNNNALTKVGRQYFQSASFF